MSKVVVGISVVVAEPLFVDASEWPESARVASGIFPVVLSGLRPVEGWRLVQECFKILTPDPLGMVLFDL